MTIKTEASPGASKGWAKPESEPPIGAEDLEAWRNAVDHVREIAIRDGLIQAEIARRIDMPAATFSLWYSGTYTGSIPNQTQRVVRWLDSYEESVALDRQVMPEPGFVETPTALQIIQTLFMAQVMPDMAIVTLGSGMSKTTTAKHYAATKPSVTYVTMRPSTQSVTTMLKAIAERLDVVDRDPIRRDYAIGQKLRRNGRQTLLIVDEAQNLADKAVDQLRFFLDEYECGIALLGNNELYSRFGKGEPKEGYGQIHRRIGKRLVRLRPLDSDIEAIVNAWGIQDESSRRLLREIGRKPGSLGQITKTIRLAGIMASGDREPIAHKHIRAAWENRSGDSH